MKRFFIIIILTIIPRFAYCQIETRFFPEGDAFNEVEFIKEHPRANLIYTLPFLNAKDCLEEDEFRKDMLDVPYRFGKGFDVNISLSFGEWLDVKGGRL